MYKGTHLARATALVVFLPRTKSQGIFWATHYKKPWFPEVALVDFGSDGWAPLYMYKGIGIYYFSSFCGLWGCGHKLRCWNKTCTLAIETLKMIGMINFFFFFIKRISFFKLLLAISHKQKILFSHESVLTLLRVWVNFTVYVTQELDKWCLKYFMSVGKG